MQNVQGEEITALKDPFNGEVLGHAVWYTCPVCGNKNLARIDPSCKDIIGRCCKKYMSILKPTGGEL